MHQGQKARLIAMPQTLEHVLLHLVFSTKDRAPWLGASMSTSLHAYLATVARHAACECPRVGGVVDRINFTRQPALKPTILATPRTPGGKPLLLMQHLG